MKQQTGNHWCLMRLMIVLPLLTTTYLIIITLTNFKYGKVLHNPETKRFMIQPLREFHVFTNNTRRSTKSSANTTATTLHMKWLQPKPFVSEFSNSTQPLCIKRKPDVLIWVYSAPKNFLKREAIRKTWGNFSKYNTISVFVIFSIGAVKLEETQTKIYKEHEQNGDIIQDTAFVDAYRNLTYKAQSMLHWAVKYCQHIKLLFKSDDDTHLIPWRFAKWLLNFNLTNQWPKRSIIGTIWKKARPARRGKWKLDLKEWPYSFIAPYVCPGSGYFITGDVLKNMTFATNRVPFLWLEDMYTTGILATSLNLKYIDNSDHHELYYLGLQRTFSLMKKKPNRFLIGHLPNAAAHYKLFKMLGNLKPK